MSFRRFFIGPCFGLAIFGCGAEESDQTESAVAAPGAVTDATASVPVTTQASSVWDDDPEVELRINDDARGLTERLVPELSELFGLDFMTLPDQILAEDTSASWVAAVLLCHDVDTPFTLSMNDIVIRAPLDSDALVARFAGDRKIQTNLDLPTFDLDFELEFVWPRIHSAYCDIFGTEYDFRLRVDVDGVVGALDVTMSDSGQVEIASVDRFVFDVGDVAFDSSFLTSITNLGLSAVDLFGVGCGADLTECVNNAIDDNLENQPEIEDALRDTLNDAIARTASIEGAVNLGPAKIDYAIGLESVTTNDKKDRLVSRWDVEVDTDEPVSPCAAGLRRSRFAATSDRRTDDDVEIMVPYKTLTDLLYVIAVQGDLCAPFVTGDPRRGTTTVDVKPVGAFLITPKFLNTVELSIPVEIEAEDETLATSHISATLRITGALTPACDQFELTPMGVDITGATGTMEARLPNGTVVTMSAATFINSQEANAERAILTALGPGIAIGPGAYGLDDIDHWAQLGQIVFGTNEVTLGMNLVPGHGCP